MVFRVGLVVLWVRLLLRYKRLPQVLDRLSPRSGKGTPDAAMMKFLAYYVDCWLRLFPYNTRGNCFPRALALYRFARQLGYPVRFHCGVRRGAAGLDGHAWVTLDSEAFNEPGTHWQYFTVTFSYPHDLTQLVGRDSVIRPQSFQVMEP
jgi:hypothetical protein